MKLDGRSGGGATVFSHELRPAAESETARQRSPIKTKKKRGRFSLLPSFFSFCSVLFFSTDRVNRRTGSGRRSRGADVRIMFADSRPFLSIRLGLDPTASSRKKKRNEKKKNSRKKSNTHFNRGEEEQQMAAAIFTFVGWEYWSLWGLLPSIWAPSSRFRQNCCIFYWVSLDLYLIGQSKAFLLRLFSSLRDLFL